MIRIGCAAAALATAFLVSTTSAQTPAPAAQTPRQPNTTAAAAPLDSRTFIEKMSIVNLAEAHLGRMAQQQGENADVKQFGEEMVKDHQAANQKLQQIATRMNVKPATEMDAKHRELADKLSKLKGSQFDREYIMAMVQGHEEVRAMLTAKIGGASRADDAVPRSDSGRPTTSSPTPSTGPGGTTAPSSSTSGGSSAATQASRAGQEHGEDDLTAWAKDTLEHVEKHLAEAREIQKELGSR